ncbi:MAG: hypothetical protein J6L72_11860 [Butyricicoccus sp.]|nr:hypothetical protein [Butyricicoccus sp.]
MTSPAEKLFVQCCMRDIPVPVQFPQMPQFQQLYASLAPDAQTQLYQLMDAHALAFSEYGAACFAIRAFASRFRSFGGCIRIMMRRKNQFYYNKPPVCLQIKSPSFEGLFICRFTPCQAP